MASRKQTVLLTGAAGHEQKAKILDASYQHGMINRARYEECKFEMIRTGPTAGFVEVPQRMKGGILVSDHSGLWTLVSTGHPTQKAAMKSSKDYEHCGNEGRWKWNQVGNKQNKRCNAHVNCPVQLRARENSDHTWRLEVVDSSHAMVPEEYARLNSAFTYKEADEVQ